MTEELVSWVSSVIEALGYVGVAMLVALESIFPPIPSEVVLPLAGFVAGKGEASVPGMIAAATAGSVIGAAALYGVSAWIGPDRMRAAVVRHGRYLGIHERDLTRAETWFDRRRDAAVLIGRCVPLVRSIVSIPAGFRRMPFGRYLVMTTLGSATWNAALIGAGALLGNRWRRVEGVVGLAQGAVALILIAVIARMLWRRVLAPRLGRSGDLPPD